MSEAAAELRSFFELSEIDPEAVEEYSDLAYSSFRVLERFAELLGEFEARGGDDANHGLKVALGYFILGKAGTALEWFGKIPEGRTRSYYAAQALFALRRFDEALREFQAAAARGWDAFYVDMQCAAIHVRMDNLAEAQKIVDKRAREGEDRGEWYYVNGLLREQAGDREGAVESFENALTLSPDHSPSMFSCARLYDMCGDDKQAIELYKRLALQPQAHVNALLNLAVIHEDRGEYDQGLECVQRVLRAYPNHTRARLLYKDIESCCQMVIDDATEQRVDSRNRLLDAPISEFELSVRARNCLKKMKIHTLGDLVQLSEAELLAYKNFGETSLNEIKALLAQKGLRLGQLPEEIDAGVIEEPMHSPVSVPPGSQAVLAKSVAALELSVRARRCLQRLQIATVSDLMQHTEADLLATRNFGVTSLNEINSRLADLGLKLPSKQGIE